MSTPDAPPRPPRRVRDAARERATAYVLADGEEPAAPEENAVLRDVVGDLLADGPVDAVDALLELLEAAVHVAGVATNRPTAEVWQAVLAVHDAIHQGETA